MPRKFDSPEDIDSYNDIWGSHEFTAKRTYAQALISAIEAVLVAPMSIRALTALADLLRNPPNPNDNSRRHVEE